MAAAGLAALLALGAAVSVVRAAPLPRPFGRKEGSFAVLRDDAAGATSLPLPVPVPVPLARLQQHLYAFQPGGYKHNRVGVASPHAVKRSSRARWPKTSSCAHGTTS